MSKFLFLITFMFVSVNAYSSIECSGAVRDIYVSSSGGVTIRGSWRQNYTQICDVQNVWKGVSSDVCKVWLALALAAKTSSQDVMLYYGDEYSCDTLPLYSSSPSPETFRVVE